MEKSFSAETRTRITTGVVAGSGFLALLIGGGMLGITFLTAVITLAMVWEFSQMFLKLSDRIEKQRALLGSAWLVIFANLLAPRALVDTLVLSVSLFFIYFLVTAARHAELLKEHFFELCFSCFALCYIVGFMTYLPLLRGSAHGLEWTLLFFLIVWSGDTGAYFAGRRYGGRKVYPVISPGKTVSGAIGGLVSSLVFSILFKLIVFRSLSIFAALLTPLLVGAVSQVGDLCESFLKRSFGVKDTSRILPGHGGMLDRFDGVLFSLPIMYLCCRAFG